MDESSDEYEESTRIQIQNKPNENLIPLWNRKEVDNHRIIHVVPENERKTSHVISLEELTEAIGIRTSQIECGAVCYVDITDDINPIDVARKEFMARESPLIIERKIKDLGSEIWVEHWKVREMTFLNIDQAFVDEKCADRKKYIKQMFDTVY